MTAQSGDQRHVHTGSRRHTSTSTTATTSSKTRFHFSKKATKVAASVFVALAVVLFFTVTFDRDNLEKGAAAGRDHHDLAGNNGKRSSLDIPSTPLPRLSKMRLRRGFLRGNNERASKDSSDELEDCDTIQALSSSLEGKREESFTIVTRDADAALKAADDAVKAGVVAVAAAEEASDVSTVRK